MSNNYLVDVSCAEKLSLSDIVHRDDLSISSACLDEMFDHIFKHQDSMLSSIIWINATFKSNDGKCLSPTFFLSDLGDYCGSVLSDSQSHFSHIRKLAL